MTQPHIFPHALHRLHAHVSTLSRVCFQGLPMTFLLARVISLVVVGNHSQYFQSIITGLTSCCSTDLGGHEVLPWVAKVGGVEDTVPLLYEAVLWKLTNINIRPSQLTEHYTCNMYYRIHTSNCTNSVILKGHKITKCTIICQGDQEVTTVSSK